MHLPLPFDGESIHVIIETPKNTRNKYGWNERSGLFHLKKILPTGTCFPVDFGFIPRTCAKDGDPFDAFILMEEPAYTGCVMKCRIAGIIIAEQTDANKTIRNDIVIAIPEVSRQYSNIKSVADIEKHIIDEIIQFFVYYHAMESIEFKVPGLEGPDETIKLIKKTIK